MKAARFHAKNDVRIDGIARPIHLKPDELLVKNEYCGICGTDIRKAVDAAGATRII